MNLPKWSRFHLIAGTDTKTIESNEILMTNSEIKFDDKFYNIVSTYVELLENGNIIYHHHCNLIRS